MAEKTSFVPYVSPSDYYVGKITNISRLQNFATLKTTLQGFGLLHRFEGLCFGFITRMKHIEFTAGFLHHILLMQDRDQSGKELRIIVNGTPHLFGYEEFSLITGMMFIGDEGSPAQSGRLRKNFFKTDRPIKKVELEKLFANLPFSTEPEDVLRLALIYSLEIILLADHNLRAINDEYLDLVEDVEKFNIYPWGKIVYDFTVRRLKKINLLKVGGVASTYSVYGFSWALQVWAYEAIQVPISDLATCTSPDALPRILRWENEKKGHYLKFWDINHKIFQASDFHMLTRLTPNESERNSPYLIAAKQYASLQPGLSVPNVSGLNDELPSKGAEDQQTSGHSGDKSDPIPEVQKDEPSSSHSSTSIMQVLQEIRDLKKEVISIKENQNWMKDVLNKLLRQQQNTATDIESVKPGGNSSRKKSVPQTDPRKVHSVHILLDEDVVMSTEEEPVVATSKCREMILFSTEEIGEETTKVHSDHHEESVGVTEECPTEVNLGKQPVQGTEVSDDYLTGLDFPTLEKLLEAAPIMTGTTSVRLGSLTSKGVRSTDTSASFGTTYTRRKRKAGPSLKSPYVQPKRKAGISIKCHQSDEAQQPGLYDPMRGFDEARYTYFLEWLYNHFNDKQESIIVGCPSKGMANSSWFHRILKPQSSLLNEHIDCGLWLLRKKEELHPHLFLNNNWTTVDSSFCAYIDASASEWKKLKKNDHLSFWLNDKKWFDYVSGVRPDCGKPWVRVNNIYGVILEKGHWITFGLDIRQQQIDVYDSLPKHIRDGTLKKRLHNLSVMIPDLIKNLDVVEHDKMEKWPIYRNAIAVPKQVEVGDCGIYALKFIEYLVNEKPLTDIKDEAIGFFRKKLCCELFFADDEYIIV